jgi:hypothetical protein
VGGAWHAGVNGSDGGAVHERSRVRACGTPCPSRENIKRDALLLSIDCRRRQAAAVAAPHPRCRGWISFDQPA